MSWERVWQQSSINNANAARSEGARAANAERERAQIAEQAEFDAQVAERRQDRLEQANDTMAQVVTTLAHKHREVLDENEELKARLAQKEQEMAAQQELLQKWMLSQKAFRSLYRKYGKTEDGTPVSELPQDQWTQTIEDAKQEVVMEEAAEERAQKTMKL